MNRLIAILLSLVIPAAGLASTIRVDVHNLMSGPVAKRRVTITLVEAGPVALGNWVFVGDSVAILTDTLGIATFTNMLTLGSYRMDIAGAPSRSYLFCVWSTNETYNVTELFGACTTNQIVNYYTADQIDAMGVGTNISIGVVGVSGQTVTITNGRVISVGLYSAPTITAFTNNLNIVEIGTTNTQTVLGWTLGGGAITNQSLNQSINSLAIGLRTYTHTNTYSTDRTYTLTVTDGTTPAVASTTVSIQNKIFWGASAQTSLTDAQITNTLSATFATTRLQSRSIAAANSYLYFAWPTSFGTPSFVVDGFADNGWTLVTRSFVNSSGYPSSYDIYRHTLIFIGGTYAVTVN